MGTVFRERISRKTTRYGGQILSKDNYSRILPMQIQLGNIPSLEAFTPMPAGVIISAVYICALCIDEIRDIRHR